MKKLRVITILIYLLEWVEDIDSGEIIQVHNSYTREKCICPPVNFGLAVEILNNINSILKLSGTKTRVYFLTPVTGKINTWMHIRETA